MTSSTVIAFVICNDTVNSDPHDDLAAYRFHRLEFSPVLELKLRLVFEENVDEIGGSRGRSGFLLFKICLCFENMQKKLN